MQNERRGGSAVVSVRSPFAGRRHGTTWREESPGAHPLPHLCSLALQGSTPYGALVPWLCSRCDRLHDDLPLALAAGVPEPCLEVPEGERDRRVVLGDEVCALDDARFFVRGNLALPIRDDADARSFVWTLWVELDRARYKRAKALWLRARREREPPYPATLATALPGYPSTVGLPARLLPAPVGLRFAVALDEGAHPLVRAQQSGVSMAAVQSLAEALIHGGA